MKKNETSPTGQVIDKDGLIVELTFVTCRASANQKRASKNFRLLVHGLVGWKVKVEPCGYTMTNMFSGVCLTIDITWISVHQSH